MNLKTLINDLKWRLKYELFRHVMPRLEYDPFTIKNICTNAWPKISTISAANDFSTGIREVDWRTANIKGDGSDLLEHQAKNSCATILRGYAQKSELVEWSMRDLAQIMGDITVSVRVGNYAADFGQPLYFKMQLRTFLNYIEGQIPFPDEIKIYSGLGPYVGNQKIPELANKLPQTKWFLGDSNTSETLNELTTFWLGSADSITPLHNHHFCDTLLIQLIGFRNVTLIPPHEALYIGYMPQNINIGTAAFDPYKPDFCQFPHADKISVFNIELSPGDALLIPGFWFHAVKLSGPSLSGSQFARSRMPAALGGGPTKPWQRPESFHRGF